VKLVQIGILIALVVVGVLLFQVYRGQQQPLAGPVTTAPASPAQPAEPPSPAATETPKPAAPPEKPATSKPSPVTRRTAAPEIPVERPVAVETPEPVASLPTESVPASSSAAEPQVAAQPVAAAQEPPPPPAPRTVTIAAGTLISARLSETLASDKVKAGDAFSATLDRPLVVDGYVIAERGARASGRIVEAVEAGRVRGLASLSIQLIQFVSGDGQHVDVQTDAFRREADASRKEDATKVGGGAGIGAIIGAIAGGGKGAAIGAAIGGAAGAGTVAATRGQPATLPVETRIDFRLTQPVVLTEKR
jgi:hypothetical protein